MRLGIAAAVAALLLALLIGGAVVAIQSPRLVEQVTGREAGAGGGLRVLDPVSIATGRLRVEVADELWQREVRALFPLTEEVAGLVRLHLRNPGFVEDGDPAWLRLALDLEAEVKGSSERFPGRAVLRTRLRFDRERRMVLLADAQLAEFSFSGAASGVVAPLKGVLARALATELRDFELLEIPEGGGWLQKTGAGLVADVIVEGGKVVVVLGR